MAIDPIQRQVVSGWNVACWKTDGVPPGLRSSYQRTPETPAEMTEWLVTRASWSPKFRYASRYIIRSPRESTFCVVPGWGMQSVGRDPPVQVTSVKGVTEMAVGPVRVELLGVAKSTWNFQRFREFSVDSSKPRMYSFEPVGGAVAPSRFAARRPPRLLRLLLVVPLPPPAVPLPPKHCWVAAVPLIIAVRSMAQTSEPRNEPPVVSGKML
jgi:hypothetical protein